MRRFATLILVAISLQAKVTITPAKQVAAAAGTTIHFKANTAVTWSLAPGSAGSIDANGDYHAPATIPANDNLAGCQLLPNDHILNTRIDSLPVNAKSTEWMSRMPPSTLKFSPSWGINIADNSTPVRSEHFFYTAENDGKYQIPEWPNLKRESGVFSEPGSGSDRHMVVVNRETCNVFELYNNYETGFNPQCASCTAQSGVAYSAMSDALPTAGSTDAAGLLLAPLTLRLDELLSGAVKHALRFTFRNNIVAPASAWPSTAHAGAWGTIPYGTRFRLKSGFDISRFSPLAKVLLTQLKEYGLIVADGGLDWDIQTSTDVMEDYNARLALQEISAIGPRSNNLEAIDESELMISPSSGRVNPRNRFVKPDFFAIVIATDAKDPSKTAEVPVSLQGVTIGVPDPAIWIQSGVETELISWVNGTQNKTVLWSMKPPLGELSASGIYKAPKVDRPTATLLTATSSADPNAKSSILATVMPPGPIRIDVGDATRASNAPNKYAPDYGPDSEGHMWWRDQASESHLGAIVDYFYNAPWPKIPDIGLYYTSRYALGDMVYRFLVPNGNYKIALMIGQPDCNGAFDDKLRAPVHFEVQGQLIVRNFDLGAAINNACVTPLVVSLPATVNDNGLHFALRTGVKKGSLASPLLNALAISPDADPPHVTVTPSQGVVTTGESKQVYAIRWFTKGEVQWSLSGPGTLSQAGLYAAPSIPPRQDQTVRITAHLAGSAAPSTPAEFTLKSGDFTLAPAKETILRSLSKQFTATFGAARYANITWSVTPPVGTVSASGLYTAPAALARDTPVKLIAQSKDDPSRTATASLLLKAVPDPIRIRCGGPTFTDAHGFTWSSDYGFSADTVSYSNAVPIAGASSDMQTLYQGSRYRYVNEPFSYHFDLPNGLYAVTLKFADYSFNEAGHYSFDVTLNGKKVLTAFDPDQERGPKTAVDKEFNVNVTDRQMKIDFLASKGAAFINGIQIVSLGEKK